MKKIPALVLACALVYGCGSNEEEHTKAPPAPILVKDTEARDLKGPVRSFISVSWQSPTATEMDMTYDSLYSKVTRHIARYAKSDPSFIVSDADAREAGRAHIQKDAFDTNGHLVFLSQYKRSWRPRRAIRSTDTVVYFDTAIDGNIIYHDTTTLNPDRSIHRIVDEFTTITDSILRVTTSLVRLNILRTDSTITWAHTTSISGHVPEPIPPATDTVTYKVLANDTHGNPLKVLVSHTDKQQPNELIMYRYTYYE